MTEEFFEQAGWEVDYEEAFPQYDYTEGDLIELFNSYEEK
jgi:hypothetical protein